MRSPLLFSSVLFGHFLATEAANPIFGAFATAACEACLDDAFTSCPGDYKTLEYAECMCAGLGGEGARKAISCMKQQCDFRIYEKEKAVIALATYCVGVFKDTCPAYKKYLPQSVYERECPSSTSAAGGTPTGTIPISNTTTDTTQTAATTTTSLPSSNAPTAAESKAAASSQSKSASLATAAAVPVWGIIAGLFAQAANLAF
ncbi:hypothetical protein LEL_09102 [Akanthomyces lecanii RCEF 1005]|uniref:Extracellular membrane protein, CFEM domain protein n=1 Tax=Akanthomyces lecanii RCEF 1005 TaxID=1081108 RepID=A0A168CWA7_CORDF|nr:hypothetical protein LEL_09102 [Akanthomyces lecanii RCEF 1005]